VQSREWPDTRPTRGFFDLLVKSVAATSARTLLVAGAEQAGVLAEVIRASWPSARVEVTRTTDDESAEHARLSGIAPFDVVVHAADVDGTTHVHTFRRVFWHLRAGGIYLTPRIVPRPRNVAPAELPLRLPLPNEEGAVHQPDDGDVWDLVATAEAKRLGDFRDESEGGPVPFADLRALGRAVGEIRVVSKMLWLRNGTRVQAKLTEDETDSVLLARPEFGHEVAQVDAATLEARAPYRHNRQHDPYFSPVMSSPRMRLRRYDRPICSRGQIVTSGDFIWPDTFRHHLYPRLTNFYVEEAAPRFGRVRRDISEPDELPGVWFHLDNEWPGHFGHMLTDQLGRMWAWDEVKRIAPEAKVLLTLNHDREPAELHGWEIEYFAAFGIEPADVRVFTEPCRPEVLYSATSMFSLADYVHPGIVDVWRRAGDALARKAGGDDWPERIFCTRPPSLKRPCHNIADVEALFRRHGFAVVDPVTLPLADQVAMFRRANAVAGFVGSALFNLAFCPEPTPVFAIGPATYNARNEHLICAALGHPLVTAWTGSDVAHPPGSWTAPAFGSGFTVDLDVEGRFLEEHLAALPGSPA
jgi:capsular polysaccharide biosynthesis protein